VGYYSWEINLDGRGERPYIRAEFGEETEKAMTTGKRVDPRPGKHWLGTRDLMLRYGVSDRTLDAWVAKGLLPEPNYIGTRRRWDEQELEQHERLNMKKRGAAPARLPGAASIEAGDAA
jgi:predicted DNA-binding transcriptional regulator AlpA